MSTQLDKSAIGVRYLLGELSAEEEQGFEQEYFADDELFEDLQVTEAEVIDAYVANELNKRPRKHFEQRLAISPRLQQRLAFARTFAESRRRPHPQSAASETVPDPWWRKLVTIPFAAQPVSRWALAATAIAILAVAAAVVQTVRLRNESQRLAAERAEIARQREELARLSTERDRTASELREAQLRDQRAEELIKALQQPPEEKPPGTPTLASIILTPGLVRSADDVKELPLTRGTSVVRLQLVLPPVDYGTYRSYRVTITSPGDKEIKPRVVRPTRSKTITLLVPATRLPPGTYTVTVTGVSRTGDVEPVSEYTFRVSAR